MKKMTWGIIGGVILIASFIFGGISNISSAGEQTLSRPAAAAPRFVEFLNTDRFAFREEINKGRSLEEIAVSRGADPQTIKAAFAKQITAAIQRANLRGIISDEQADSLKATLAERIDKAFVQPGLLNMKEKRQAVLGAGAVAMGMTLEAMEKELTTGKSIKELANDKDVPVNKVISVMEKKAALQVEELVFAGILPDFLAERIKDGASFRINNIIQSRHLGQYILTNES